MKYFKSLIVIMLLAIANTMTGQSEESVLDRIDFNDTTMINSDLMWQTIAEYITTEHNKSANPNNQMYNMILAADNILSRSCTSFVMYKSVYQYLISGFSELGATKVVDYMLRMPYFEYLDTNDVERAEMMAVASKYERVKIGLQAPDIQSITIKKIEFTLNEIKSKNTLIFFWSYSCPHCREMLKELGRLAKKDKDLTIITVNVSGDLKKVKCLLKKSGLKKAYNVADGKGWDSPIVEDYAVDMTPSLFLLDENKIIIAKPFDIEEVTNIIGL